MNGAKKEKHPSILDAVHETAKGLYDAHVITAIIMEEFDDLCLAPKEIILGPLA